MSFSRFLICLILTIPPLYSNTLPNLSEEEAVNKLKRIQSKLVIEGGSFTEEYPEQLMSVMFISPEDCVLEIGGNIGRNSLVISKILKNSDNLVILESDPTNASTLLENRNRNKLKYCIENACLSQSPLFQLGWKTYCLENAPEGAFPVKTITYQELKKKYKTSFSALVADSEGALYYILQEDETLLDDVSLIIVENDYDDITHYEDTCSKFMAHGFKLIYNKPGGFAPCYDVFYQVWKK